MEDDADRRMPESDRESLVKQEKRWGKRIAGRGIQ